MPSVPFIPHSLESCESSFSKKLILKKPCMCNTVKLNKEKGEARDLIPSSSWVSFLLVHCRGAA